MSEKKRKKTSCPFASSKIACSRLSISGSERKQRRAKNQAIQNQERERGGSGTDPLTEGLEQATSKKAKKTKIWEDQAVQRRTSEVFGSERPRGA